MLISAITIKSTVIQSRAGELFLVAFPLKTQMNGCTVHGSEHCITHLACYIINFIFLLKTQVEYRCPPGLRSLLPECLCVDDMWSVDHPGGPPTVTALVHYVCGLAHMVNGEHTQSQQALARVPREDVLWPWAVYMRGVNSTEYTQVFVYIFDNFLRLICTFIEIII